MLLFHACNRPSTTCGVDAVAEQMACKSCRAASAYSVTRPVAIFIHCSRGTGCPYGAGSLGEQGQQPRRRLSQRHIGWVMID